MKGKVCEKKNLFSSMITISVLTRMNELGMKVIYKVDSNRSTSLRISRILVAICSALFIDFEISSDFAIIEYIDFMFESIVSVSFVTEFL